MRKSFSASTSAVFVATLFVFITSSIPSSATICIVPDNGDGTAELPPAAPMAGCTDGYLSPDDVHMIIDGLPAGTTIEIGVEHTQFLCQPSGVCSFMVPTPDGDCDQPSAGLMGAEEECTDSAAQLEMQGTGTLATFARMINLPIEIETHVGPRTLGDPVQSFDTDMFRLNGQMIGDPDFDLLRIVAGTNFGLPSPGHTTLTKVGDNWNVDSFFDITYRIDFIGAPGGALAGMSGSTTGTIRMQAGETAVYDHLECFKAKDTVKVAAEVNLLPTLAGTAYEGLGCTVGSTKRYCTPAIKTVLTSTPAVSPLPGPNLTSNYICYKLKCPKVSLSTTDTDQFGPHTLSKMKQAELCVPAP